MLVLASLGSWLPFAIVGLVDNDSIFAFLSFNTFFVVHYILFAGIYITLSTKTTARLSCDTCLLDFLDYCLINCEFIAHGCHSCFVYEISQWNI